MKGKVAHLSSVHASDDPRIFVKECRSLAKHGYEVYFVVPVENEMQGGAVKIVPLKKHKSRLKRMLLTPWSLFFKALKLKADIYHIHDPELLPTGLFLKLFGKKVIFDAHENVRQQIMNKYYLPKWIRKIVSKIYGFIEDVAVSCFDGLVTVVPSIAAMFPPEKTSIVANFPLVEEIEKMYGFDQAERKPEILFSGALTEERGALKLMEALNLLLKRPEIRLQLAGTIRPEPLYEQMQADQAWSKVEFHGWVNREKIMELLRSCSMGIVTYLPSPNYYDMSINKLYEYMAAYMPIIASDISQWREKLEHLGCCLFVDPADPKAIAEAVLYLLDNSDVAREMGEKGRLAVTEKFNWGVSEQVLFSTYERILGQK